MLPNPLHPAIVHMPMALVVLLPLFAGGALWAIRRGAEPLKAWGVVVGLSALLAASSWVAVQTGEQQEETVEAVVSEGTLHDHEEAAEAFLALAAGGVVLMALGLLGGRPGTLARLAGVAGTLVLLGAGWRVGHSGGELVYRHGAAMAYTAQAGSAMGVAWPREGDDEERER